MFLLDTNIVSELNRSRPSLAVVNWVRSHRQSDLFISVVTIVEITQGITRHPDPVRRQSLQLWLDDFVRPWLYQRILPISEPIAEITGRICGQRDANGKPIAFADAAIAATALDRGFTLITRNVKDFADIPLPIINPWET